MSDILERAEKYLEDFGSSGKIADCLIQELVEALKSKSYQLEFVEGCRKDWSTRWIAPCALVRFIHGHRRGNST